MAAFNRIPVDYYLNGEHLHQDKYGEIPPVIGQGVEIAGRYYRIADVWAVSASSAFAFRTTAVLLEEVELPAGFPSSAGMHAGQ